jgi:putative hydrolase of the HAD superfamily
VTSQHPIEAVLFDIGGVLVRTPFEMLDYQRSRLDLTESWRGPFDPASDPLFADVASGRMTERAYWAHRVEELAPVLGGGDPQRVMAGIFAAPEHEVLRREVLELIDDLESAGLAIGLLTNDLAKFHGGGWEDALPSLARITPLVDLSHTEILKPHPDAYRAGVDALGAAAGGVLFVDDQPVNVDGAVAAGLQAVHFDVTDPFATIDVVRDRTGIS